MQMCKQTLKEFTSKEVREELKGGKKMQSWPQLKAK